MMFDEYQDRVGDVVTGIVQQSDNRYCLVDLGKVEALLPGSEQVPGERYEHGARIKAVIIEVRSGTKGPQIVLSRRSEELLRELFELEVPEIADGLVVIRAVAREPGYRSKIAVESRAQGVDPVGACVGPRGSRVRMVVSELRGEKIDIIPWNDEPARFVAKALAPARVKRGARRRREPAVDGDRAGRPAVARDRPRGPERPSRDAADRLARSTSSSESEFAEEETDDDFSRRRGWRRPRRHGYARDPAALKGGAARTAASSCAALRAARRSRRRGRPGRRSGLSPPGPDRSCIGCGPARPQPELVRLRRAAGTLVAGGGPGRGAYLCPAESCAQRALGRGALSRRCAATCRSRRLEPLRGRRPSKPPW